MSDPRDPNDPLSLPCAACNAERDEPCNPGCLGVAAREDAIALQHHHDAHEVGSWSLQDCPPGCEYASEAKS